MGSTRRSFTPEYKAQSVAFVLDGGRPVAEVARNIGVHEMTLGKWVKVARDAAESGKNGPARGAPDAVPRSGAALIWYGLIRQWAVSEPCLGAGLGA
ncbi:MAG: transposase [Streptosporangiaceae bacterium]